MTLLRKSLMLLALTLCSQMLASDVDLSIKNPAIEKVRAHMTERSAKVDGWKDKGAIGEASTGLLAERTASGITLVEKKEIRDLIAAENEDRSVLFREIRIAQNLAESDLAKVAEAFAAERRATAGAEHWLQNPADKTWVQKKDLK
jgi:hypothetical protein